jgi:SAM-dependent methyltransferase
VADPHPAACAPQCPACGCLAMNGTMAVREFFINVCPSCGHGATQYDDSRANVRERNNALFDHSLPYSNRISSQQYLRDCGDTADDILTYIPRQFRSGDQRVCLDVGCSTGGMLLAFAERGWKCLGIEPSEAIAHIPDVMKPAVEKCFFGDETVTTPVDLVMAFHVLEHVPDPVAFLHHAARRVKPGGFLVVEVPDFDFARRRLRSTPDDLFRHISPKYHFHHYTAGSLSSCVARAGFKPLHRILVSPRPWIRPSHTSRAPAVGFEPDKPCGKQSRPLPVTLAVHLKQALWTSSVIRRRIRRLVANDLGLGQYRRLIARKAV